MSVKQLTRSRTNRGLFGVCGGLGEYLEVDATLIRLLFVFVLFLTHIVPFVFLYSLAALVIPNAEKQPKALKWQKEEVHPEEYPKENVEVKDELLEEVKSAKVELVEAKANEPNSEEKKD